MIKSSQSPQPMINSARNPLREADHDDLIIEASRIVELIIAQGPDETSIIVDRVDERPSPILR